MSTQYESLPPRATIEIGIARLGVGLVQGLALYLLYSAVDAKAWPATDGLVFAPLLFVSLFVPLLIAVSLGNLRAVTLAVWAVVGAVIVAGLAWYDIWHILPAGGVMTPKGFVGDRSGVLPSFGAFFFTAATLFIGQALIAGGDADRRAVATYSTHFDVAWKLGLQGALAIVFVGVFWGVLELGAELFSLIGIGFFRKLIEHDWFAIPATTLAIAISIHLTDVRASLVRGARTLCLVLLAWLLPLMTIIAAGFLGTLIFTGLDPLWKTRFAAGYLLIAAGALVILINAAYQDGHPDREAPRILRCAGALAGLLLVPLAIIAGYAILLRVRQYGWTTDRVGSVACLTMAAWYAVGYAAAALLPGPWLKHMERWNFLAALLALAVVLALFSPIADPERIAVASQMARLESGQVSPGKFDFAYLRWEGGRFGDAALRRLSTEGGRDRAFVQLRARRVLAMKNRYEIASPTPVELSAHVVVYPKGRALPAYFRAHDWANDKQAEIEPWCLRFAGYDCDAVFIDAAGDGREELLFLEQGASIDAALFQQSPDGSWQIVSSPASLWNCSAVVASLRRGDYKIVVPAPPPPSHWRNVVVAGQELSFPPLEPPTTCPN